MTRETAVKAIEAWRANPATTFTPANILREFGDDILTALRDPAPPASAFPLSAIAIEAKFLLDRLLELDDAQDDDYVREFEGHVRPPMSRLARLFAEPLGLPHLAAIAAGPVFELSEDDPTVLAVARGIAENGFARPWDDFLPLNVHDTDQSDLVDYAKAAIAAMPAPTSPEPDAVREALDEAVTLLMDAQCEHPSGVRSANWHTRRRHLLKTSKPLQAREPASTPEMLQWVERERNGRDITLWIRNSAGTHLCYSAPLESSEGDVLVDLEAALARKEE